MTEDWTNTGAFTQQAAEAAGLAAAAKAAAENVAKATVDAANQTTKAALDNATRVLASAVEAGKAAAETSAKATASATKAATEAAEKAFGALAPGNNPTFEAAGQQVQEQSEALTAQAKQAAAAWLDLYDQGFASFVELRNSLAKSSQIDAVIDLANTNTQALEQLNASFTSAVRDLLK
jgi:hypothetical protein